MGSRFAEVYVQDFCKYENISSHNDLTLLSLFRRGLAKRIRSRINGMDNVPLHFDFGKIRPSSSTASGERTSSRARCTQPSPGAHWTSRRLLQYTSCNLPSPNHPNLALLLRRVEASSNETPSPSILLSTSHPSSSHAA